MERLKRILDPLAQIGIIATLLGAGALIWILTVKFVSGSCDPSNPEINIAAPRYDLALTAGYGWTSIVIWDCHTGQAWALDKATTQWVALPPLSKEE